MRGLTLVMAFYENQGMLREQIAAWRALPATVRDRLHVVVVDDCSPDHPAVAVFDDAGLASQRLYRTLAKVRWNWLFARNLGVSVAPTEWVLVTDMDHLVPRETLETLLEDGALEPEKVYRFSRVDAPRPRPYALSECPPYKPHPNTWLLTRAMYDRIGGYDERLSGCYGTDGEFRDRVIASAAAVVMRPDVIVRYPREIIPDASTVGLTRKNDEVNDHDLAVRRKMRAGDPHWKPLRVTFPHQLEIAFGVPACRA